MKRYYCTFIDDNEISDEIDAVLYSTCEAAVELGSGDLEPGDRVVVCEVREIGEITVPPDKPVVNIYPEEAKP